MNLRNLLSTILVSLLLVSIFLQPQQLLNASTNSVAPREKTDFVFRIDPDGQVSAKGSYEGILDSDSGPIQTLEASLSIDENKEVSSVVVELSPEAVSEFPFNTSTVSLAMDYANNLVTANLNASTRLPVESASQFPFNSTDLTVKGKYLVGDLNLLVDATIDVNLTEILQSILPLIGFNQSFGFPMVMNIHYSKGNYDGTIVLHLLPGFPIGDLETSVTGNLTDIRFSGTVNVIYMNYLGTEINSTFIDMIEYMAENVLNASIDTPNSLLNMTEGQLSCPYANIERENITGGEGIAFDVRIHGDFVAIFAQMLEPLWESGFLMGNIPTWMQVQRYNFTYMLLNDTLHKIQNTDLEVSYTPVDTKCLMTLNLTLHIQDMVEQITEAIISGKFGPIKVEEADFLQAINSTVHDLRNGTLDLAYVHNGTINLKAFLAADVKTPSEGSNLIQLLNTSAFLYFSLEGSPIPESIDQPINELMNKTFVEVTSTHQKLTYSAGTITYTEEATYTGDINAEANYIKSVVLKYFNLGGEGLPWQAEYINQTWLGVAGADLNLKMESPGYTLLKVKLDGLTIKPPLDVINATAFGLERLFNLTSEGSEFPGYNQTQTITILGGSNSTHKVTISRDSSVPQPDVILRDALNRTILMTWNNATLSSLKKLIFIIASGSQSGEVVSEPGEVTPQKPVVINATDTMGTLINITGVSDPVNVVVSNVTTPGGVLPPPGTWKVLGNYVQISVSNESASLNATIRMYYTDQQVASAGVAESTLKIYRWNGTAWKAIEPSYVNTQGNYVWANVNHFSLYALMGDMPPTPVSANITNVMKKSLNLTWTTNTDPDFARYEAFRSATNGTLGSSIANFTNNANTSMIVSGLSPATRYYLTVRVWDTVGLYADSSQVNATTAAAPTAVTVSASDVTENSLKLAWTQSPDPFFARYEIFSSTTTGSVGTSIQNVTAKATLSFTVSGLTQGTTYYYTVRVWDTEGLPADSTPFLVTTAVPIWQQTWFIGSIAAVVAVVVVAIVLMTRKRPAA